MTPAAKWTMVAGGLLTLGGPAIGLLGAVLGLISGFDTLGQKGVTDAESLGSAVAISLISTAGGIAVGFVGLLILMVGLAIWFGTRWNHRPEGIVESR